MARHATLCEAQAIHKLRDRQGLPGEQFENAHSGRISQPLEERPEDLRTGERVGSLGGRRQVAGHRVGPSDLEAGRVTRRSTTAW